MRAARILPVIALAACATAQANSAMEPQNFNVAGALEDLGVDVKSLPQSGSETTDLTKRSSPKPCSLAVSPLHYLCEPVDIVKLTVTSSVLL